jgi:hypothetical protein
MRIVVMVAGILCLGCINTHAQEHAIEHSTAEVRLHIVSTLPGKPHPVPEVMWLSPLPGMPILPFEPHSHYTLLQKNRMFTPHLLVIPVGSTVQFPNADPFFHNVFSLFDGKRFDLGLYEAGSSKSVSFSKEGVSYIFCNIHPDMSAVILALSTPLYAVADSQGFFQMQGVPAGEYELHLWVEGVPQPTLNQLRRHVRIQQGQTDLGGIGIPIPAKRTGGHPDMFGKTYGRDTQSNY